MTPRFFEDYPPGAVFTAGSMPVSEAEIVEFARKYDPQTMHTDPDKAAEGRFGGLIASGWHSCAVMMRLFAEHYLSTVASLGSPGVDELRWLKPVRPGDTLRVEMEVTESRPSQSKPDRGIVRGAYRYVNQNGEAVLTFNSMHLLKRRPA